MIRGRKQDAGANSAQDGDAVYEPLRHLDLFTVDGAMADGVDGDGQREDQCAERDQVCGAAQRDGRGAAGCHETTGCGDEPEHEPHPGKVNRPINPRKLTHAADVHEKFAGVRLDRGARRGLRIQRGAEGHGVLPNASGNRARPRRRRHARDQSSCNTARTTSISFFPSGTATRPARASKRRDANSSPIAAYTWRAARAASAALNGNAWKPASAER